MKLKALILALFLAAGLSTSVAFAGNGHGKGGEHGRKAAPKADATTTTTKSEHAKPCKPAIQLEFAGTAAAAPTSDGQLAVLVTKGRAGGASLAGKQLTLDVSQAKVHGTIAEGSAVRVHARACVDVVALTVKLQAAQVNVGGGKDGSDDGDSTSSTTSTTESTSTD